MPGKRAASIDLPVPGGPIISTLCAPAAATSSARFACCCPLTSLKSAYAAAALRTSPAYSTSGVSPARCATTSSSDRAGRMRAPSASAACGALPSGSTNARPAARAESAMASAPRTARSSPVSESSPANSWPFNAGVASWPLAARMPSAIGRSKRLESFGSSAGARLTVMRRAGNSKWPWLSAARTRSRASRTSASGRPTMWNAGSPGPRCTSTVTSGASIPASARLATVATVIRFPLGRETLPAAAGLLARFELGDARLEFGQLGLRALEKLLLHFEVFAQHEVEAVEPGGEQRAQILLDVLGRRTAQRLVDLLAQFLKQAGVDHGWNLAQRGAPGMCGSRRNPHHYGADLRWGAKLFICINGLA